MKKRNIILITIIVLTILMLIGGVAYAYFAVSTSNVNNTSVDVNVEDVGVVTLSGGKTLHINLVASDMAEQKAGTSYYATVGEDNYSLTEENIEVAKATLNGGSNDLYYGCTFNLNTSVTGNMKDYLKNGDAKIVYSGILDKEEDLTNLTENKEISITMNGDGSVKTLNAYVVFNNTYVEQNDIAGKNLKITITPENFECDILTGKILSDEARELSKEIAATEIGESFRVAEQLNEELTMNNTFVVLAKEESKALVLYSASGGAGGFGVSYAFDTNGNTDWSTSTLRTTLNNDFLTSRQALSELVMDTTIYTRDSNNKDEYITTIDKVFIMTEADRFGTMFGETVSYESNPKDYTIAPDSDGNILPDSITVVGTGLRFDYDYMWLRTPGIESGKVRYASTRTQDVSGEDVPSNEATIYPLMWVDISSVS